MKRKRLLLHSAILLTCLLVLFFGTNITHKFLVSRLAELPVEVVLRKGVWMIWVLVAVMIVVLITVLYVLYERQAKKEEVKLFTDQLTGLPNWQYLQAMFEENHVGRDKVYLLTRIPDFFRISEVFGYQAAAQLLKNIANEMTALLAEGEVAVHVSEDCFVMLLNGKGDKAQVQERIHRIFHRLRTVDITEHAIVYDYRWELAGGAYVIQEKDNELTAVNRKANSALEMALGKKDIFWLWFENAMETKISLQNAVLPDLLDALKNEEFVPFFQPQYWLESKEIVGAEVLARWQHPKHGTLLPGIFVPMMEAAGCVLELDLIMLEAACKTLRGWLDNGMLPVRLTINISRLNIHRQDFFEQVIDIVRSYEIPTNLIGLELREAAIADNQEKVIEISQKLREYGFNLSMDEFGAGDSVLNFLHKIPIDIIKLSRGFLRNFDRGKKAKAVLRHVVEMGHELGIYFVAEGIETAEQEAIIKDSGCNMVQGFYYSKPMSVSDFEKTLFAEEETE